MPYKKWSKALDYFTQKNGLDKYLHEKNIHYKLVNGCWECTSHKPNNSGYPVKSSGLIHREIFTVINGKIPVTMLVCHTCDNRMCINPNHLWLGTMLDNQQDKLNKNRQTRMIGEKNGRAKLSLEQVKNIINDTRYLKDISKEYGVNLTMISRIKRREAWNAL